jgi:hypothetical protein
MSPRGDTPDITLIETPMESLGLFSDTPEKKKKRNVTWSMLIQVQYLLDPQS